MSVGYIGYYLTLEKAKTKVCIENQKVIYEALKIYALENYKLPGTLGEIPSSYYQRAYVKVINQGKNSLWTKLAYLLVDIQKYGLIKTVFAFPDSLLERGLIEKRILDCPKDDTPYSEGGISYGLNSALVNASFQTWKEFGGVVIGDCDDPTFDDTPSSNLAFRHKAPLWAKLAVIALRGGNITVIKAFSSQQISNSTNCLKNCATNHTSCINLCGGNKSCIDNCNDDFEECREDCVED